MSLLKPEKLCSKAGNKPSVKQRLGRLTVSGRLMVAQRLSLGRQLKHLGLKPVMKGATATCKQRE